MSEKRLHLIEIQDFLVVEVSLEDKGELALIGPIAVFVGFGVPNWAVFIGGLIVSFMYLRATAIKRCFYYWGEICKRYTLDTYQAEWDCCENAFYQGGLDPFSEEDEECRYHNPKHDRCWLGDEPLFNLKKWDDEIDNYKVLPNYHAEAKSCLDFKDIVVLGITYNEDYFVAKILPKTPIGFPEVIHL
jgi:hypothetical protein